MARGETNTTSASLSPNHPSSNESGGLTQPMQMTPERDVILIGFHLPGGKEITFPIGKTEVEKVLYFIC